MTALAMFSTTEITERNGNNGMSQPDRAVQLNSWPIGRFLAHSRSWTSSRRSVTLGEKSQSATLRAKECARNRTNRNCRWTLSRNRHRLLSQTFRLHSFNRGAADLGFFAVDNGHHLNAHESEWRKSRIIGRIRLRRLGWTVPSSSVDFRAFRSKKRLVRGLDAKWIPSGSRRTSVEGNTTRSLI